MTDRTTETAPPPEGAQRGAVTLAERSLAPDIARGFMLLLIALAHAPMYVTTADAGVITHPEGGDALDRTITFLGVALVDNRAYPMFAALFGYGLAMVVNRQLAAGASPRGAKRLLMRRGLFLMVFGYVHFVLIFPADILFPYGLAAVLFGWIVLRGDRALLRGIAIAGGLGLLTATLSSIALAVSEEAHGGEGPRGTVWASEYGEAVVTRLTQAPFGGMHVLIGWPVVAAILVGALAARRRYLDDPARHRRLLRHTVVAGFAVSLVGAVPLALIGAEVWRPSDMVTGWTTALHVATGFAGGLAYAALFGLLAARSAGAEPGVVSQALAAVGRRSLTCYLLQSALLALILARVAFGLGDHIHSTGAALVGVSAWLAVVATAWALQSAGKRGPLDALLRRLVYGRR